MPDGDYYRRTPRQVWKSVHRMVLAGAPPEELAGPTRRALAHTLRRGRGLPGLVEAADILQAVGTGQKTMRRALGELQSLEGAVGRSVNAALTIEAARGMLAEVTFGGAVPVGAQRALAERACSALVDHHLLALAQLNFVGKYFRNFSEARHWEEACRVEFEPDIRRIAAVVAGRPSAEKLRAPARRTRRRSTADLLHQPVPAR